MGKLLLSDVDIRQGIFKGGMKTPAGKQRIVPIHSCIQALVKNRYDLAREAGSEYLFFASDGITHKECTQLTYDKYAGRFDRVMEELGIKNHRPHDPRKTFVTMAKNANPPVNDFALKRMVGHRITDITEAVYTERSISWLKQEIEKIKGPDSLGI